MSEQKKEKMLELLSDKAIFGLSDEEFAELAELEKDFPAFSDDSLDLAAASIGMLNLETSEPMPAHLRSKIAADAEKYFAARKEEAAPSPEPRNEPEEIQKTFAFEPKRSILSWLGWAVAAAACIALAVNIYTTRTNPGGITEVKPTPTAMPKIELTLSQQRDELLASAKDLVKTPLGEPKPTAQQISGEVVWSNTAQTGFVTFRGLAPNDPNQAVYQLWIVDETRDKYPVDGGVFDVNGNGEIVIQIDAKLKVTNPKMFAITREKPGGVVVSSLGDKLVAVAKVSA